MGSSSDIKNWTDFQITWFENNDPEDVIEGSFENKPPYRPKVKFLQDRKGKGFLIPIFAGNLKKIDIESG